MAYEALTKILKETKNLVFFGGAGVSTASGIPDFRSANGLYNQRYHRTLSPEEMISHSF
ncbi:MAG: NAD-dependent protein deacylase, partial [Lachnospiraceae bacterium]|nr:NAD-dependent protein deacylase [Lachnospiraceae bacterium]